MYKIDMEETEEGKIVGLLGSIKGLFEISSYEFKVKLIYSCIFFFIV